MPPAWNGARVRRAKMSKTRGNAVFANDVLASDGADALRWYLLASGSPWLPKKFDHALSRHGQPLPRLDQKPL